MPEQKTLKVIFFFLQEHLIVGNIKWPFSMLYDNNRNW